MKGRVLIIVENLPAPFDRRVWQEARTLAGAGLSVSIICPKARGYERAFEVLEGVRIHRHPLPQAKGRASYLVEYATALVWQLLLTLRIALLEGIDVIHACNPPDTIFLVAALFRPFGVRFVFDHHDLCPELYEAKYARRGRTWRLLRALERATFQLADVVIATNESYRRIALARGGKRSDRVFVVRSGPNLSDWPVPSEHRSARPPTIGYLGVMGEQEGLDLFLSAFRRVRERAPEAKAVLIGDGPERPALQALAARLGLAAAVHFPGRLPDGAMRAALGAADLCVNPDRPSRLNDLSTMNKVLEYMALGKAQVQFESREGRASAGDAALYARPGDVDDFADKVLRLLQDEPLRRRMGAEGRLRVERSLAWSHQEAALLAAYKTALAPRRMRRAARAPKPAQA